jgi:hypothetical protein
MTDRKLPTPEDLIMHGINAINTGTVPENYGHMTPIQFAALMELHALFQHTRAASNAHPYRLEAQHQLVEAMEEVRNGNRHPLFDPKPRAPGERKPKQSTVLRQAFCVITIEMINATGKSIEKAADEVVATLASWMGAFTPKSQTVIDWRRWIREQPDKHPELVALYQRAKASVPGDSLREKVANLLTVISTPDIF